MVDLEYKTYPYVFCKPGDTIRGIVRHYNDITIDNETLEWLLNEFKHINKHATPPKLGQQVQIPVLLQYCEKHERKRR